MGRKAKILTLDIETSPAIAYVWHLRDQRIGIEQIKEDSHCLMWCAKWLGEHRILSDVIINHPQEYRKNPRSDRKIAESIQPLLEEADIVVTQNGNSFDLKWLNNMFLRWDIPQPSHYYSVDLLRESRKFSYSLSHRLDFRGRQLNLGGKKEHEGFRLWLGCMAGDKEAFGRMLSYCKRDVQLTEDYYLKLRPRITNHPNVNMFHDHGVGGRLKCPACGSGKLKAKGWRYNPSGKRQRVQCDACGHYSTLMGKANNSTAVTLKSSS